METLEKLCQEMDRNKHILTFSQIAAAGFNGASIGHKSGVPGGVVIGATLAVCVEAGESALLITQDLIKDSRNVNKCKQSVIS